MDDLKVINNALSFTGNFTVSTLNDGSDEAIAAEIALQRAKDFIVAAYEWSFHTKTAALTRLGDSDMPPFAHAMQYPPDCWHLRSVIGDQGGTPMEHRIVQGKIHTMYDTGILAFYVTDPTSDQDWHPLATEALTIFVESGIYRGLNEDQTAADRRWQDGEAMLARAAGRDGQQSSPRPIYRSRSWHARRLRRYG